MKIEYVISILIIAFIGYFAIAPSSADVKKNHKGYDISHLTKEQHYVTQENGTEKPFTHGNYHSNKRDGIYVDIVGGQALYSSTHKFNSGTGWPSFTQPIDEKNVIYKVDTYLAWILGERTEVRSANADSHLGHVFEGESTSPVRFDGKKIRHCINGAALKFIPKEDMEKLGYGEYLYLFKDTK